MKKKFLSLMMAAAVVATTSVSAFAAEDIDNKVTEESTIDNVLDSDEIEHNVNITGKIQNKNGVMPATTFKVTVPTAANFTVSSSGELVGPDLTVKNEGSQAIEVLAKDFKNVGSNKIKVIAAKTIKDDKTAGTELNAKKYDRTTISLKLEGDSDNVVHLSSSDGKSGISSEEESLDLSPVALKLVTLQPGDKNATTKTIKLKGTAGAKPVDTAVSDKFRLTLKIKKAEQQEADQ